MDDTFHFLQRTDRSVGRKPAITSMQLDKDLSHEKGVSGYVILQLSGDDTTHNRSLKPCMCQLRGNQKSGACGQPSAITTTFACLAAYLDTKTSETRRLSRSKTRTRNASPPKCYYLLRISSNSSANRKPSPCS